MTEPQLRAACAEDAAAICEIYNHAIRTSTATFDTIEKTVEDREKWLTARGERYPVIVAVMDGEVAGWGSLSKYGERPGWRFTVENAVYVRQDFHGRGIGRAILERLIELGSDLGYGAIVAQVVGGNDASIRLHEKCGFETIGVLRNVGHKFDRWLDVIVMERELR